MKRLFAAFVCCAALFVFATGCSGQKLSADFDAEKVEDCAKSTVEVINTRDYDAVAALVRDDLKEQVSSKDLKDAWDEKLSSLGEFREYKRISLAGIKDGSNSEYAVAAIKCSYENGTAIYTLSYDINYELVGLYMK